MQFLLKLFKALNSAQSPWQVTLAITLGMIAGLTPISGLQNAVILLIAFLLNIHLGLFFVSAALFAGIGYLFDPWFEQLGYAILSSEGLQGLWTGFYNNSFVRLTHFNNTLVMGATVVSLLLAVPLYLLLGFLIGRYRTVLAAFLERRPVLGTFGFLKATTHLDPTVRWWGAGLYVAGGGIVTAVALLVIDPLLKWTVETGGSFALQRDVRVGAVDTDFSKGAVTLHRLEVAGKKEGVDAVSADLISFDADLAALLMDKVHIEKMIISGVGFDTPATLKKSPAEAKAAASEEGAESAFALPTFEFPDPKTLIAKADLQSVKVYNDAQKEIGEIKARWEKASKEELTADSLSDLQADLDKLKTMSQSKDPQSMIKLAQEAKAFKAKVEARKKALAQLKADFDNDRKRIASLMQQVKDAPMADYNRLKSTYTLDGNGALNVIGGLFGEKIKGYLAMAREYYAMVSPYLGSAGGENPPEEAVPPRGEGRWIRYPQTVPSPDMLVALTQIDGLFKSQAFSGTVNDISDNQKALGRPLTFKATSDGPTVKGLVLSGEDNRLGDTVKDSVNFKAMQIPLDALDMKPVMLDKSNMAMTGTLSLSDASALTGNGSFAFSNAAITAEGLSGKTGEIVSGILSGISAFKLDTALGGTLTAPTIGVTSDLDRQISQGLGKAMGKELEKYQGELKSLLGGDTAAQLADLKTSESGIADVNKLVGDQNTMLGKLAEEAAKLAGGGAVGDKLKGALPF
ncbi:TIGR03545 family protein [Sulfurimonas sp. HSL-1656]|uniref:TIGR03545 family protein n=1 Tax=Thiomicrolovo subterrani TaxID=3131934 RepID=UPI0031F8AE86